jgi:hypothetical protein
VSLDCHGGGCTTNEGIGAIVGGVIAAVGVAVVAVLVLRAMGEWKTIKEERALEEAAEAAAAGAQAADTQAADTQAVGAQEQPGDPLPPE